MVLKDPQKYGKYLILEIDGSTPPLTIADLNNDNHLDMVSSGGKLSVFMNIKGEAAPPPPPSNDWGAASVIGVDARSASDMMNCLLMLGLPMAVMGLLKKWRKRG